jgi:hypothetical protein
MTNNDQSALTLSAAADGVGPLDLAPSQPLLTIHPDGTIDIPDGVAIDEAALAFWQAAALKSAELRAIIAERDRLRAALKLYKDAALCVELVETVEAVIAMTSLPVGHVYVIDRATVETLRKVVTALMA